MNEKQNVALLYGGRGAEHEISVRSAKFVLPLIDREHFNPYPILIKKDGSSVLCPPESREDAGIRAELCRGGIRTVDGTVPISAALPLLHGDHGEDGEVQGLLLSDNIPTVGCGVSAGAVSSDKAYTKLCAESLGIPTAEWILSVAGSKTRGKDISVRRAELSFGYPMFVKPAGLGSSFGASVATCREELLTSYDAAASIGCGRVIIEEKISVISELECGYFSAKGKELFTKIGEISSKGRFYGFDEKYSTDSDFHIYTVSPREEEYGQVIRSYARALTELIGIRHLGRFDFFLSEDGRLLFNEVNTMPGFTAGSLYPRMLESMGLSPAEAINLMLEDAVT